MKVTFNGESAIDIGGVTKDFFVSFFKEIIKPERGLFKQDEETTTIWFHEGQYRNDNEMEIIGRIYGMALLNMSTINLPFPLALFKVLLSSKCMIEYQNLMKFDYRNYVMRKSI